MFSQVLHAELQIKVIESSVYTSCMHFMPIISSTSSAAKSHALLTQHDSRLAAITLSFLVLSDKNLSSIQLSVIQRLNGVLGVLQRRHLDNAVAFRASVGFVDHDASA